MHGVEPAAELGEQLDVIGPGHLRGACQEVGRGGRRSGACSLPWRKALGVQAARRMTRKRAMSKSCPPSMSWRGTSR